MRNYKNSAPLCHYFFQRPGGPWARLFAILGGLMLGHSLLFPLISNAEPSRWPMFLPAIINGGSAVDTVTKGNLMWQQADDGVLRTWNDAQNYCNALILGGYADWRMPTKDELKSLVVCSNGKPTPLEDYDWSGTLSEEENLRRSTCGGTGWPPYDIPTIDSSFTCNKDSFGGYIPNWSSTLTNEGSCSSNNCAKFIYWNSGMTSFTQIDSGLGVRCVRSLPSVGTVTSAGQVWMDRNLGASRVATSMTDAEAYGDLYQWGRLADGHQRRTSPTTSTLSSSDVPGHGSFVAPDSSYDDWRFPQNGNLWQGVSGTNNPCPAGFRLPTMVELNTERFSWSSQNYHGAFASPLKLVPAGFRYYDGTLYFAGSNGLYWSSTVDGSSSRNLSVYSGGANRNNNGRGAGFSVRCLKD